MTGCGRVSGPLRGRVAEKAYGVDALYAVRASVSSAQWASIPASVGLAQG